MLMAAGGPRVRLPEAAEHTWMHALRQDQFLQLPEHVGGIPAASPDLSPLDYHYVLEHAHAEPGPLSPP